MSFELVPAIIFTFVVGGLVRYVLSTTQALTAAAATADAVPIPDTSRVQITTRRQSHPAPRRRT
jgi:hypothetical protein